MNKVSIGKKVPAFTLPATGDKTIKLSALKGKNIVLYFYPKDNIGKFNAHNTIILGISRDKLSSHEKFKQQQCFPFDLLSDEDETLCNLFDVIKEKNMYGKKILGIERSTFLIDEKGVLYKEWRKVKVKNHVNEILETLERR